MKRIRIVAAMFAALVLAPSAAQAQTSFTACFVPKTGTVYRIKVEGAPNKCSPNHVEFTWSSGTSTWGSGDIHSQLFTVDPGAVGSKNVLCPVGHLPMNGGFLVHFPNQASVVVLASYPLGIVPAWSVTARNDGAEPAEVTVYATCVEFNPN